MARTTVRTNSGADTLLRACTGRRTIHPHARVFARVASLVRVSRSTNSYYAYSGPSPSTARKARPVPLPLQDRTTGTHPQPYSPFPHNAPATQTPKQPPAQQPSSRTSEQPNIRTAEQPCRPKERTGICRSAAWAPATSAARPWRSSPSSAPRYETPNTTSPPNVPANEKTFFFFGGALGNKPNKWEAISSGLPHVHAQELYIF